MNHDKSIKGIRKIAQSIGISFTLAEKIKKSLIESKIIMVYDKKTFAIVDRNEALKRVKSETLKVKNIVNFEQKKRQKISM